MQLGFKTFFAEKKYKVADRPDFLRHIDKAVRIK